MNQIKFIILLAILSIFTFGCTQNQKRGCSHFKSNWIGLDRTITLYSNSGQVINQWKTRSKVETEGSVIQFFDNKGKDVKLSGTVIVQEN